MNWSITEKRNDNNELEAVTFSVHDSTCISSPVNYSDYTFKFKLHYAKDGKRILCIKEDN